MELSVVVPVHNEVGALERCLSNVERMLEGIGREYEILIAEDGSTDGTFELGMRLAEDNPRIRVLHSDEKLGRGKALNRAFMEAEGKVVMYMDVDLATDLSALEGIVEKAEGDYDIAIGSRMSAASDCERSLLRDIASRGYNLLGQILFPTGLHDLQCGFKAFKKDKLMEILDEVESEHWFWDSELLIRAKRKEFRITEVPVAWREGKSSKVVLAKDIRNMGSKMLRLWWELNFSGCLWRVPTSRVWPGCIRTGASTRLLKKVALWRMCY